jgi:cell division inhibitor SepF
MNRLVSTEVSVMRRNARDWLGRVEHDNDGLVDSDGYLYEEVGEVQGDDETPSGQLAMGNGIQIAVVRPRNFRDAATVGEYYRQEIPVIINLENMDNVDATRIIDFVSGLILGLGGDIERISRRAFLIVPADATILTTHNGLTEEGFFNQALRRQPWGPSESLTRNQQHPADIANSRPRFRSVVREHCPVAREEARFLLVGPEVTSNAAGGKPDWSYTSAP